MTSDIQAIHTSRMKPRNLGEAPPFSRCVRLVRGYWPAKIELDLHWLKQSEIGGVITWWNDPETNEQYMTITQEYGTARYHLFICNIDKRTMEFDLIESTLDIDYDLEKNHPETLK